MRRLETNYKKDGLTQFFPVLFVKNNQEDAWLFGIGKWNLALVKGKNPEPEKPQYKAGGKLLSDKLDSLDSNARVQLTEKQKKAIIYTGIFLGTAFIAFLMYKNAKTRKEKK